MNEVAFDTGDHLHRYGQMGTMATLPEFKGRGLAQYAMASLANHIKCDLDLVPFCNIMTDNNASLRGAQKVGLKRVGEVYFG